MHIGDFYLPFAIQISRNHVCNIEGREYSEDEMKALAEQHIATYIGELQEKGVQIVQKNVIITNRSDKLVADGNMIVRMSVGFPRTLRNVVSGNNIETVSKSQHKCICPIRTKLTAHKVLYMHINLVIR